MFEKETDRQTDRQINRQTEVTETTPPRGREVGREKMSESL